MRDPYRASGPRRLVVIFVLLTVALATSAGYTQTDPRTAEIKKRLERFGMKVTDVSFEPAKGATPAVWAAGTAAKYDKPSWDKVTDQALTVWNVLFAVLKGEAAATLFVAPQDWKTYRLLVATSQGKVAEFDKGTRTAQTDADRQKVFQTLYGSIVFRVFDTQQQKMIDQNAFVKDHFTK